MSLELRRASGTSLHRQIFVTIRDEILRGIYAPGSMLATDEELCRRFDVSRITVRRAVADLVSYGLLEKRELRTYVTSHATTARAPASLPFIETMLDSIVDTKVSLISIGIDAPATDIAEQMLLQPGERAIRVVRMHSRDKLPLMLTDSWVPLRFKKNVSAKALKHTPLYRLLLEGGATFQHAVEEHTAVVADVEKASILQAEVGTPLLRITRCVYDSSKTPVQRLTVHITPERSRVILSIDLSKKKMIIEAGRVIHDGARSAR